MKSALWCLCLMLLCLPALYGCQSRERREEPSSRPDNIISFEPVEESDSSDPADEPDPFPELDDPVLSAIASDNTGDALFRQYDSLRRTQVYRNLPAEYGAVSDVESICRYVSIDEKLSIFGLEADGTEYFLAENEYYEQDGQGNLHYGVFLKAQSFSLIFGNRFTTHVLPLPEADETRLSDETVEGTRTVVTGKPLPEAAREMWQLGQGTMEVRYALDAETGLIRSVEERFIPDDGGEPSTLLESSIAYGEDDGYALPEYVTKCRETENPCALTLVIDPGAPGETTLECHLPRDAFFVPIAAYDFKVYSDQACTQSFTGYDGHLPESDTLYIQFT